MQRFRDPIAMSVSDIKLCLFHEVDVEMLDGDVLRERGLRLYTVRIRCSDFRNPSLHAKSKDPE